MHLGKALAGVDMMLLTGQSHVVWMDALEKLETNGTVIAESADLETSRAAFIIVSNTLIEVAAQFGTSGEISLYRFHCPMAANNQGADWLQNKKDIENPFLGSSMLTCGELVETISEQ